MEMGEKIYNLRTRKGLTLEELGNKVGVGKSTVRKWEKGMIANMKRDKIAKLASALDTTPAYLMGWEKTDEEIADAFQQDMEQDILKKMNSVFPKENVIHFEKYNQLNKHNMKLVDSYTEKLLSIQEMEENLYLNAANENNPTPEQQDSANSIMKDDSEWE